MLLVVQGQMLSTCHIVADYKDGIDKIKHLNTLDIAQGQAKFSVLQ